MVLIEVTCTNGRFYAIDDEYRVVLVRSAGVRCEDDTAAARTQAAFTDARVRDTVEQLRVETSFLYETRSVAPSET